VSCEHIQAVAAVSEVASNKGANGCPDCVAQGFDDWVHLRKCCACGHVGCCDSSPRRHASAHFAATSHPVMRSLEPGETWKWCFVDETIG
jgi:hypothetical protein